MKKKKTIIKGAFVLAVGAFAAKALGALYRIPLTNILGSYGLGLYQTVFPVYCLLLDFAGAGVPNALSSLIASDGENSPEEYLRTGLKVFSLSGIIGSVLLFGGGYFLPELQGDKNARFGYFYLSPSVFFVALIACFRGYFQGKGNMIPTALSQVSEQMVKIVVGLGLLYFFSSDSAAAVGRATFAVSFSEAVTLVFLIVKYKKTKDSKRIERSSHGLAKKLVKAAVPVTLTGMFLPITQFFDSFIVINALKTYLPQATSLFGLYSGAALTVVNLPVSLCYGIAVASVPFIAEKEEDLKKKNSLKAIGLTFAVSLVFSGFTLFFADKACEILFSSLSESEKAVVSGLIKLLSVNVVFSSILQTVNASLIGQGRYYTPLCGMTCGAIIKIILTLLLSFIKSLNIYGAGIGLIACYFFALLVNFIILLKGRGKSEIKTAVVKKYRYQQ